MCKHLTYLAQHDRFHSVACCPHGAIHFRWGQASLHLRPMRLLDTADFLLAAQKALCKQRTFRDGPGFVFHDERGYVQLWLWKTGFYLSQSSFAELVALVLAAVERWHELETAGAPATNGAAMAGAQTTLGPTRFSIN